MGCADSKGIEKSTPTSMAPSKNHGTSQAPEEQKKFPEMPLKNLNQLNSGEFWMKNPNSLKEGFFGVGETIFILPHLFGSFLVFQEDVGLLVIDKDKVVKTIADENFLDGTTWHHTPKYFIYQKGTGIHSIDKRNAKMELLTPFEGKAGKTLRVSKDDMNILILADKTGKFHLFDTDSKNLTELQISETLKIRDFQTGLNNKVIVTDTNNTIHLFQRTGNELKSLGSEKISSGTICTFSVCPRSKVIALQVNDSEDVDLIRIVFFDINQSGLKKRLDYTLPEKLENGEAISFNGYCGKDLALTRFCQTGLSKATVIVYEPGSGKVKKIETKETNARYPSYASVTVSGTVMAIDTEGNTLACLLDSQ